MRDFIEYLGYFEEAGWRHPPRRRSRGRCRAADDRARRERAWSFRTFLFCASRRATSLPARASRNSSFPPELMKEEKPQGDFQIQEERRLFYVALTRARQQLTLSTIVNKRKKPSLFLDDFLMNPQIQKLDAVQSAPKVACRRRRKSAGSAPDSSGPAQLFGPAGENARAYSRVALWAKAFHPPRPEPLQLSPSAIGAYERCPMQYMFQQMWSIRGGAERAIDVWERDAHDDQGICGRGAQTAEKFRSTKCSAIYDREWSSAGFSDDYHEAGIPQGGARTARGVLQQLQRGARRRAVPGKTVRVAAGRRRDRDRPHGPGESHRRKRIEIVDYKTGKPRDAKGGREICN